RHDARAARDEAGEGRRAGARSRRSGGTRVRRALDEWHSTSGIAAEAGSADRRVREGAVASRRRLGESRLSEGLDGEPPQLGAAALETKRAQPVHRPHLLATAIGEAEVDLQRAVGEAQEAQ